MLVILPHILLILWSLLGLYLSKKHPRALSVKQWQFFLSAFSVAAILVTIYTMLFWLSFVFRR